MGDYETGTLITDLTGEWKDAMRMFRNAVLCVLMAFGIVVGANALPADAGQWPPGVVYRSVFRNCVADITSGDFGQSFSNLEFVGSGCTDAYIMVTAVVPTGNHVGNTPWCNMVDVLFNGSNTYCTFLFHNGIIGVQAHLPGSTAWLQTDFKLCDATACSGIRTLSRL